MSENTATNGGARYQSDKVRVAIVGVGNCASSFVQGVEYYKDADPKERVPGLMHVNLGGYHVRFRRDRRQLLERCGLAAAPRTVSGASWFPLP